MRLPQLKESADVPLGMHRASLRETLDRFAVGHPRRIAVEERLERIYHVAAATGHGTPFILLERSNRPACWRAVAETTGVVDQITTIQGSGPSGRWPRPATCTTTGP